MLQLQGSAGSVPVGYKIFFFFFCAPRSISYLVLLYLGMTAGIEPATQQWVPGVLSHWATAVTRLQKLKQPPRENVSTYRTVCMYSFSDQKCVVLYVLYLHDQLIAPTLTPSPRPLLHHTPLYLANERSCAYVHSLVYNLVRPKTSTLPFILNDVWSIQPLYTAQDPQCSAARKTRLERSQ